MIRSHLREHGVTYALALALAVCLAGISFALHSMNEYGKRIAVECGRAGGVELTPAAYDEFGSPSSYWCLDANGDRLDVPEWR